MNDNDQNLNNQPPLSPLPISDDMPTSTPASNQVITPPAKKPNVILWLVLAIVALVVVSPLLLAVMGIISYTDTPKTSISSISNSLLSQNSNNTSTNAISTPLEVVDALIAELSKNYLVEKQRTVTYAGLLAPKLSNSNGDDLGLDVPSDDYLITTPTGEVCSQDDANTQELIDEIATTLGEIASNTGFSPDQRNTKPLQAYAYENNDYFLIVDNFDCPTSPAQEIPTFSLRLTSIPKTSLNCNENIDPQLQSLSSTVDAQVSQLDAWSPITTENSHQQLYDILLNGTQLLDGCVRSYNNCTQDWTQRSTEEYAMFALVNLLPEYDFQTGVPRKAVEEFITKYFDKTIDARVVTHGIYDSEDDVLRYEFGGGNLLTYELDQVKLSPDGKQVVLIANAVFPDEKTRLANACIRDSISYIILDVLPNGRYIFNSEFIQDTSTQIVI